jgi:GMP synthase PP-ATPase subunit
LKPRLKDVASIAEVIGAIAIIISLVYVGIQVDDSTRAVRSATANETATAISAWYAEVGIDANATQVFLDGIADPESLSREETGQFIYMMHGLMLQYQAAYYLSQEGTLDEELRESVTNTILGIRDQPGIHLYWRQRGKLFKPSFREHVDGLLSSGSTNTNLEELYRPREPE